MSEDHESKKTGLRLKSWNLWGSLKSAGGSKAIRDKGYLTVHAIMHRPLDCEERVRQAERVLTWSCTRTIWSAVRLLYFFSPILGRVSAWRSIQ